MDVYGAPAPGYGAPAPTGASQGDGTTANVWQWNLGQQMAVIRRLVDQYRYVAVDVKFPGIVARPMGTFRSTADYHYQTLRANVDLLRVVQVGLTITDAVGNVPPGTSGTWQFNFRFNAHENMSSADGLEILRQSGLELAKHEQEGIDPLQFAELLVSSGLVLNDRVTWVSFHSGYDLGFLLGLMANKTLPVEMDKYMDVFKLYFASVWDVKTLTKQFKLSDKNNLHEVAQDFGLTRGTGFFPAGADSRLSALCFFEILRGLGENNMRPLKNMIYGLVEDQKTDEDGFHYGFRVPQQHALAPQPQHHTAQHAHQPGLAHQQHAHQQHAHLPQHHPQHHPQQPHHQQHPVAAGPRPGFNNSGVYRR